MNGAHIVLPIMIASCQSAAGQSLHDVRLTEGALEHRYSWMFGYSAIQRYKLENLTDTTLVISVECGFESDFGYADGSGDMHVIPPRQSVDGVVGGDSITGNKIKSAGCSVASVRQQ